MSGRLEGKAAIVTGAGQTEGREVGNGRATAIAFGRESAKVLIVALDRSRSRSTMPRWGSASTRSCPG
jgi:NAD(P)-dependent dehydrogenase (short-subunit alcohol dehydrogenase family)